jgi:hypothetical protein
MYKKLLRELRSFTKECREDMHEPDEQGISASVEGEFLDNAFGKGPSNEFVVELKSGRKKFRINLADLIALARKASLEAEDFSDYDDDSGMVGEITGGNLDDRTLEVRFDDTVKGIKIGSQCKMKILERDDA